MEIHPKNDRRHYFWCQACQLIFTEKQYFVSDEDERARYDLHGYNAGQPGHMVFLEQILNPMLKYVKAGMTGLDYGCGPKPIVSAWLNNKGIQCDNYDPFYGFKCSLEAYDFIVSTEVAEHFRKPLDEWNKLAGLLKPGGYLMIMTERWKSIKEFESWHYKTDATHVCFYHLETFSYIGKQYGLNLEEYDEERVVIMRKKPLINENMRHVCFGGMKNG